MNGRQCSSFLITLPILQKQQWKQLLLCSPSQLAEYSTEKNITQLSLPILHALTIFAATAKQSLFTNSLFQCKKETNTQMVEFQRGQDWDQAFHKHLIHSSSTLTPIKHFQSVILTRHPVRIFFLSSVPYVIKIWKSFRFRASENADYGLDSTPKESNGKALLNLTVPNKLQNFSGWKSNLSVFIKHCMETFKFLEMGVTMKS